jgi:hypothetical protein
MNQMQPQAPVAQQPGPPVEEEMEGEMYAEPGATPGQGIDQEELQGLLMSRVQQLSKEELQILDSIVTPETIMVLYKVFPELGVLFDHATAVYQGSEGGGEEQAAPMEQPDEAAAADAHPLINQGVSRGLMG